MTEPTCVVTFQPGFEALAERDLAAAHARALETLEPGVWCVRGPLAFRDAIALRHAHPVAVDQRVDDLAAIVTAVAPLALEPGLPWAVQTRHVGPAEHHLPLKAHAVNDAVAEAKRLAAPPGAAPHSDAPYDRRAPAQVLSITLLGHRLLAGVSRTADNLSAWPGGARRFAHTADATSRAAHKLEEALETFALVPKGRALDLGAAPGGWTRVLAERGLAVTAVDPAALDRAVFALPGVTHERLTAERFLALAPPAPYDLIVNDMRLDARDAARLLGDYARLLSPRAHLLTTLKLPERGYLPVLDQALDLFARRYRRVAARQLFHNRSEVTALFAPL